MVANSVLPRRDRKMVQFLAANHSITNVLSHNDNNNEHFDEVKL